MNAREALCDGDHGREVVVGVTAAHRGRQDLVRERRRGEADARLARLGEAVRDVLGSLVLHVGETGQGQTVKLVNNAVAAANAVTLAQALVVARAAGADLGALVEVMRAGSGQSRMLELKAGPMIEHDFSTLFRTGHMLKDVAHCLAEARAAGVGFPAAAFAHEVLAAAVGRGHADDDFASVITVTEGFSGVEL
jgi:3-hydroxyisobutyrate dehydrogenase-like beta-hydroxyacid dehydrogenase